MAQIVGATLRISVPTVWEGARGRLEGTTCDRRLAEWSARLLEVVDLQLTVSGGRHVEPGRAYVIMSNHQSHFDIPVLYRALPLSMRMVVKKELFRIPIWASAMRAAGFVAVDRQRSAVAHEQLTAAGPELLARGLSLWIAPEGTRSPDAQLLPFKRGGFRLAASLGLPILPVTIVGTRHVHGKGSSRLRFSARVQVVVHRPIETRGLRGGSPRPADGEPDAELGRLMEVTRAAIAGPLTDSAFAAKATASV